MGQSLQMITELRERLDVFLGKLRQRGEEIAAEARATAPEIKANDTDEYKRSFLAFQTGIGNQMHQLVEKAEQVFHKQFSVYMSVEDHDVRAVFLEAEDAVEDFSDYIDTLTESIFMESETDDAEKQYNQAVADWKEAAARFTCSQCSAPIPVTQLYYQAQYLTCTGCGTQTTFMPSTAMRNAPQAAEALAELRTRHIEEENYRIAASPGGWVGQVIMLHINYELAQHRELVRLLPAYAETRVDFLRKSIVEEARTKGHTKLEPAGTREADVTYYNVMGSLGDTMCNLRAAQDTQFANIVELIVRDLARPGCEVANAIINGTYTDELWEKYAAIASRSPEDY